MDENDARQKIISSLENYTEVHPVLTHVFTINAQRLRYVFGNVLLRDGGCSNRGRCFIKDEAKSVLFDPETGEKISDNERMAFENVDSSVDINNVMKNCRQIEDRFGQCKIRVQVFPGSSRNGYSLHVESVEDKAIYTDSEGKLEALSIMSLGFFALGSRNKYQFKLQELGDKIYVPMEVQRSTEFYTLDFKKFVHIPLEEMVKDTLKRITDAVNDENKQEIF